MRRTVDDNDTPRVRRGMTAGFVSIVLNGESRLVPIGLTVADLLRDLELHAGMVVVERNREILAREALQATPIEEGDRIELVHFVGGG